MLAHAADQTMRNFESWAGSLRDFSWLQEVVPGASDLDLVVERNYNFAIFEGKPWVPEQGVYVPYGQHKMLYHFAQQPNTDVWLIGETTTKLRFYVANVGKSPAPKVVRIKGKHHALWAPKTFKSYTKTQLCQLLKDWWDEASLPNVA